MKMFATAGLLLFSLFLVARAAQSPSDSDTPVWTMEYLKVMPGQFGPTLGYLDDNWMRIRQEAKRQGAVLSYHRIGEENLPESDRSIVLATEYKNRFAYDNREKLFAKILKDLPGSTPGVIKLYQHEGLYETLITRVFQEYPDAHGAQFRLLTRE
jgi:hypothetical protein